MPKQPALRFENEESPYPDLEEKTFSEVLTIHYGKDFKKMSNPNGVYPIFGTGGLMGYTSSPLHQGPSLMLGRKGTINKPRFSATPFSTVDTLFYTSMLDGVDARFMYYFAQTVNWESKSEATGVPSLSSKNIYETHLSLPSLAEQRKIAEFLSLLDERIELQASKVDLLKQQKQGYMQRIFSQELRFKQEDGSEYPGWNTTTVGQVLKEAKAGGTPTASNSAYYGGGIPFLSISDMTRQGKYLQTTEKSLTKAGLDNSSAWIVPEGTLVFAMYASVGKVGVLANPMATSQALLSMQFLEDVYRDYVYYYLELFRETQLAKYITTGTQGNVNGQTVRGFPLELPSLPEQKKIADFLGLLDESISIQQQKLELLRQQKQGYLRQLFN
jgi:type I restriction enzyme S subunit